jgi:hypothetical protein
VKHKAGKEHVHMSYSKQFSTNSVSGTEHSQTITKFIEQTRNSQECSFITYLAPDNEESADCHVETTLV